MLKRKLPSQLGGSEGQAGAQKPASTEVPAASAAAPSAGAAPRPNNPFETPAFGGGAERGAPATPPRAETSVPTWNLASRGAMGTGGLDVSMEKPEESNTFTLASRAPAPFSFGEANEQPATPSAATTSPATAQMAQESAAQKAPAFSATVTEGPAAAAPATPATGSTPEQSATMAGGELPPLPPIPSFAEPQFPPLPAWTEPVGAPAYISEEPTAPKAAEPAVNTFTTLVNEPVAAPQQAEPKPTAEGSHEKSEQERASTPASPAPASETPQAPRAAAEPPKPAAPPVAPPAPAYKQAEKPAPTMPATLDGIDEEAWADTGSSTTQSAASGGKPAGPAAGSATPWGLGGVGGFPQAAGNGTVHGAASEESGFSWSGMGSDFGVPPLAPPPSFGGAEPPSPPVFEAPGGGSMPWQQENAGGDRRHPFHEPPPELPQEGVVTQSSGAGDNLGKGLFLLVLISVLVFGAAFVMTQKDSFLNRWFGTMKSMSQTAPAAGTVASMTTDIPVATGATAAASGGLYDQGAPGTGALAAGSAAQPMGTDQAAGEQGIAMQAGTAGAASGSTSSINFVDGATPAAATKDQDMPQDVGFVAQMQQSILKARQEKEKQRTQELVKETGGAPATAGVAPAGSLPPEEQAERNADLSNQVEQQLAAYRKALADTPAGTAKPKVGEFVGTTAAAQAAAQAEQAGAAPAARTAAGQQQAGVLPPPAAGDYKDVRKKSAALAPNPRGLPEVLEPATAEAPAKVRTLADFNVEAFVPEAPHVRVPKRVRPTLRATSFPALTVLSFIPGRGVIAQLDGEKEGALLIGETLEGWELVGVYDEYAEFSNGRRKQIVQMKN